jgi:hypothetical protein
LYGLALRLRFRRFISKKLLRQTYTKKAREHLETKSVRSPPISVRLCEFQLREEVRIEWHQTPLLLCQVFAF